MLKSTVQVQRYTIEIHSPTSIQVIDQRLRMASDIIAGTIPIYYYSEERQARSPIKQGTLNDYDNVSKYLEDKRNSPKTNELYNGLHELSNQGWRTIVKFIARNINIKIENTPQPHIDSFFSGDIRLLFILDMYDRYAQVFNTATERSRLTFFPNMFLVRAIEKHIQHSNPIYFLKLLILLFVDTRRDVSFKQVLDIFVKKGKYEENIVRLALGSLCSTNQSNCLNVKFGDGSDNPDSFSLTERGKCLLEAPFRLRRKDTDYAIPLSLHFDCLQFFFDDYYLLKPAPDTIKATLWQLCISSHEILDFIFNEKSDYTYLMHIREIDEKKEVRERLYKSIYLTYILEVAMTNEMNKHKEAWEWIEIAREKGFTNPFFKKLFSESEGPGAWDNVRTELHETYNALQKENTPVNEAEKEFWGIVKQTLKNHFNNFAKEYDACKITP